MSSIMVKLSAEPGSAFVGIRTYDRLHGGHGRFLIVRENLSRMLSQAQGEVHYDSDCGNFAEVWHMGNDLWFRITWLNVHSDGAVNGFQQKFSVPDSVIESLLLDGGSIKSLYAPRLAPAKIEVTPVAARMIGRIAQDKHLCRAFSKAMRDCFNWHGDRITLSKDGKYSFYFTTESGYPKCGGLILHEGERHGYPYIYYSVHT